MKSILSILSILAVLPILAAKPEASPSRERKAERQDRKVVELILDKKATKGTNTVYRTGRTFPLMFRIDAAKLNADKLRKP